jgi:hypothetical protein
MSFFKLPPFWINPVYRDGTLIDEHLIDAAQAMWPEAAFSTDRWLQDVNRVLPQSTVGDLSSIYANQSTCAQISVQAER